MKKVFLIAWLLVAVTAYATLTNDETEYLKKIQFVGSGNKTLDPVYLTFAEISDLIGGTSGSFGSLTFTATDTEPGTTAGMLYYDLSESKFKYYNGSAWVAIESGSAGNSLDGAYDVGGSVTVDNGAVTLTAADAADNIALAVVQSDTGSTVGQTITSAGTGALLSFDSNGTGADVLGSDSTWNVTKAGVGTFVGLVSSTGDVTLTGSNYNIIHDASADQLEFQDSAKLVFGTSDDLSIAYDGAGNDLDILCDDLEIAFGADGTGADVFFYTESASSYIKIDEDADALWLDAADIALGDGDYLLFGDTLGTGDFSISDQSDVLTIAQVVADTGTIAIGADGAGIDTKFFGEEAGAYMLWDGTGADQLKLVGADSSGTLLNITGIDTTGNSDTITIAHSGTGAALKMTSSEADTQLLEMVSAANQTTWLGLVDGATGNWIGADDVGMLTLKTDTAGAHAGATSLLVQHATAQPVSGAEGFLARFVDTGTARTNAYAVEIETTNTTPALMLNNQLTISGADQAGTLFDITAIDTTGNTDTMTIAHSGTGDALQITCTEADSVAANLVAATSQTTSVLKVDGATGSWLGADDVGMVHLTNDGALAHVDSSLLRINNTGVPQNDSRGSCLRIVDTGNAAAGTAGYAAYISATDATVEALYVDDGNVQVDEVINTGIGYQSAAVSKTANTDGGAASTIATGTRVVNVVGVNADADDWILLPASTIGQRVTIFANAGSNFEIRTPATTNDTINTVDSDGTQEFLATDGNVYEFICNTATGWIGVTYTAAGAHGAAVVPD